MILKDGDCDPMCIIKPLNSTPFVLFTEKPKAVDKSLTPSKEFIRAFLPKPALSSLKIMGKIVALSEELLILQSQKL